MKARLNPTVYMRKGKLWGIEFEHVIAATFVFIFSNAIFVISNQPLILSWIFAAVTLIGLRIASIGKKKGFLSFLLAWTQKPHLYLGKVIAAPRQDGHRGIKC